MDVQQARIFGNVAFARGNQRAPAFDADFLAGLAGVRVGDGVPLSMAWLNGWDQANLAALDPMKITHLKAREILETTGDEDAAWAMAQQDEGLIEGVTKAQWLEFCRACIARKDA